jgi:hypothetical protein
VAQSDDQLERVLEAFHGHGGAGKPAFLQVHVAYAPRETEAREAALAAWRHGPLDNSVLTSLAHPAQIEAAAACVRPDDLDRAVWISSDPDWFVTRIRREFARGFARVYLHEVGPDQDRFVDVFGREVLPHVRATRQSPSTPERVRRS